MSEREARIASVNPAALITLVRLRLDELDRERRSEEFAGGTASGNGVTTGVLIEPRPPSPEFLAALEGSGVSKDFLERASGGCAAQQKFRVRRGPV